MFTRIMFVSCFFVSNIAFADSVSDLYCSTIKAKSKMNSSVWPTVFSRMSVDSKENTPQTKSDDFFRLGLSYNVDELFANFAQGKFVESECGRFRAETAYLEAVSRVLTEAEKRGHLAQLEFINSYVQKKTAEMNEVKKALAAKSATITDLLDIKKTINELELRKLDVESALKALGTPHLIEQLVSTPVPELRANYLIALRQNMAAKKTQAIGMPWKIALQAGYKVFPEPIDKNRADLGTAFFQVEARFAFDAIESWASAGNWQQLEGEWASLDPNGVLAKGAALYQQAENELENASKKLTATRSYFQELKELGSPLDSVDNSKARIVSDKINDEILKLQIDEVYLAEKIAHLQRLITPRENVPSSEVKPHHLPANAVASLNNEEISNSSDKVAMLVAPVNNGSKTTTTVIKPSATTTTSTSTNTTKIGSTITTTTITTTSTNTASANTAKIGTIISSTTSSLIVKPATALVKPATMAVTDGEVKKVASNVYSVNTDQMRLSLKGPPGNSLSVTFTYQGPTSSTSPLTSGDVRNQFGIYLLSKNPCNQLYIMVRMGPNNQPTLAVQTKINPGQSTSAECSNNGYVTVKPAQSVPLAPLPEGTPMTLSASVVGSNLSVQVNGQQMWVGPVPDRDEFAATGYAGIRTDNAKLKFSVN